MGLSPDPSWNEVPPQGRAETEMGSEMGPATIYNHSDEGDDVHGEARQPAGNSERQLV